MKHIIANCLSMSVALCCGTLFAATPAGAAASVNGANVFTLPSINDAQAATWTIASGIVERNQIHAGTTSNANLLLLLDGTMHQRNTSNHWYKWNGSTWPAEPDPRVVSASGKRIGTGSATLIDAGLHVWTLGSNEYAYVDGVRAATNANTIAVLYFNEVIYSENTSHAWYSWSGSRWTQVAGDPTVTTAHTPSASGTTISPGAGAITDASDNTWTLTGDRYAFENGYRAGNNANTELVLFYNNVIYSENTGSQWYAWNGQSWTSAPADPRGPSLVQNAIYTSAVCPANQPGCVPAMTGNSSVAFAKATAAGDAIWVAATVSDYGGIHSITVTDSQHNTYYALNQENDGRPGAQSVAHFYAENIVGGADTITVNWGADNYKGVIAAEIAGVKASPLVAHGANLQDGGITGSKDNVVSGGMMVPPNAGPTLILALTMDTDGGGSDIGGTGNCALPPGTAFTQVIQLWNWAPSGQSACNLATLETRTVTAAGAAPGTFTTSHNSDPYITVAAAFH